MRGAGRDPYRASRRCRQEETGAAAALPAWFVVSWRAAALGQVSTPLRSVSASLRPPMFVALHRRARRAGRLVQTGPHGSPPRRRQGYLPDGAAYRHPAAACRRRRLRPRPYRGCRRLPTGTSAALWLSGFTSARLPVLPGSPAARPLGASTPRLPGFPAPRPHGSLPPRRCASTPHALPPHTTPSVT